VKALKLLIADDSPRNLKLLRAVLESEGHQVVEAANGVAALAILEREPQDAVISDILMPSMDGFRLCHEIRKSGKSYSSIPLILYTATYDSPSDRTLADTVGADGYILKPAPVAVLIGAVQDAMQKAATRQPIKAEIDETYVLKNYSAALVDKLETRNAEVRYARRLDGPKRRMAAQRRPSHGARRRNPAASGARQSTLECGEVHENSRPGSDRDWRPRGP
jgi:CheY-like chemotaxis protein